MYFLLLTSYSLLKKSSPKFVLSLYTLEVEKLLKFLSIFLYSQIPVSYIYSASIVLGTMDNVHHSFL